MRMNPLGQSGLTVSELCLGTMTFGTQIPQEDAHKQIDMALDAGINFIDTAEMYPVNPVRAETVGDSERIVGAWVAQSKRRGDVLIATKHSGEGLAAVRDGAPISSKTIASTIEGSLKRLQTDVIDLYQFHWPNRGSYMFRKNWTYDPAASGMTKAEIIQDIEDCLGALKDEVARGTIRAFGLSNESAWGTAQWLAAAERTGGPRVVSIQNEYSLLCRLADTDLAELMVHEEVGLLPFSPLATGLLTGKYQADAVPPGSRKSISESLGGRNTARVYPAVDAYLALAAEFGLDPVHMALAWSARRPFVASSIFGATNAEQLAHLLGAADVTLPDALMAKIDDIHKRHPMPY